MMFEDPKPGEPGFIAKLCGRLEDSKATVEMPSDAAALSSAEMKKASDGIKLTAVAMRATGPVRTAPAGPDAVAGRT